MNSTIMSLILLDSYFLLSLHALDHDFFEVIEVERILELDVPSINFALVIVVDVIDQHIDDSFHYTVASPHSS